MTDDLIYSIINDLPFTKAMDPDTIDTILDEVIEGTLTVHQALRLFLATLVNNPTVSRTASTRYRIIFNGISRIIAAGNLHDR